MSMIVINVPNESPDGIIRGVARSLCGLEGGCFSRAIRPARTACLSHFRLRALALYSREILWVVNLF